MRASAEHTPPFLDWSPSPSRVTLESEVFDLHPAVREWMSDEIGERWFADVTEAAIRFDMTALLDARDRLVDAWGKSRETMLERWRRSS